MRIVEDSPRYLRLRDQSIWLAVICLAGAGFLAAKIPAEGAHRLLFPALFFLGSGLFLLRRTEVTCDRALGRCLISRLDVFRRSTRDLPFGEITDVTIGFSNGTHGGPPLCRLVLTTAIGPLPLTAGYEPGQERFARMRDTLAETILKGRTVPSDGDPIRTLVDAGRRIDAIALLRKREGLSLTEAHRRVEAMRRRAAATPGT
jgi:hypothetical protein